MVICSQVFYMVLNFYKFAFNWSNQFQFSSGPPCRCCCRCLRLVPDLLVPVKNTLSQTALSTVRFIVRLYCCIELATAIWTNLLRAHSSHVYHSVVILHPIWCFCIDKTGSNGVRKDRSSSRTETALASAAAARSQPQQGSGKKYHQPITFSFADVIDRVCYYLCTCLINYWSSRLLLCSTAVWFYASACTGEFPEFIVVMLIFCLFVSNWNLFECNLQKKGKRESSAPGKTSKFLLNRTELKGKKVRCTQATVSDNFWNFKAGLVYREDWRVI